MCKNLCIESLLLNVDDKVGSDAAEFYSDYKKYEYYRIND